MEKNKTATIAVCDAGPLIHLDELDSLDLLFHNVPRCISVLLCYKRSSIACKKNTASRNCTPLPLVVRTHL